MKSKIALITLFIILIFSVVVLRISGNPYRKVIKPTVVDYKVIEHLRIERIKRIITDLSLREKRGPGQISSICRILVRQNSC